MSDTPRTDGVIHNIAELGVFARQLERELNAANARIAHITDGFRREQNDIEQTCGKALGYPRFCDDQKNFPGSTEADGVCIGDHVAASIAAELAGKYAAAINRIKRLEEAGDALQFAVVGVEGMTHWQSLAAAHEADLMWRKAKEAKP